MYLFYILLSIINILKSNISSCFVVVVIYCSVHELIHVNKELQLVLLSFHLSNNSSLNRGRTAIASLWKIIYNIKNIKERKLASFVIAFVLL